MRGHKNSHPMATAQWRVRAKEIALEMGDDRFLELPELGKLPGLLLPGESVLAITSGAMHAATSLLALTDRRVLMLATETKLVASGFAMVAVPVLKENSIHLSEAAGRLAGRLGITHGAIIVDDGATTWRFWGIPNATVNRFLEKLTQATDSLLAGSTLRESPAQAEERSRIELVDDLHKQGLLTDDEFVALQKPGRRQ